MLSEDKDEAGKCFAKILWSWLYNCIRKTLEQHRNECIKCFRAHFCDLHNLPMSYGLQKQLLPVLRIPKECTQKEHWSFLSDIVSAVNATIIHEASTSTLDQLPAWATAFIDINSLPDKVWGKIRCCGGWALAKMHQNLRNYIKENLLSSKDKLLENVRECFVKKKEEINRLTCPSSSIHSTSSFPETLYVTDRRQYS